MIYRHRLEFNDLKCSQIPCYSDYCHYYSSQFITGSIERITRRRYLIYSQADFEVLCPTGRHDAPMGVRFGTEEGTSSVPNLTPIGATVRVQDPKN